MLGAKDSLQDEFAQPLANGGRRIEGEGREVKREEKWGLASGIAPAIIASQGEILEVQARTVK